MSEPITPVSDPLKGPLVRYLDLARDAVRWKLEGVSDTDLRRPLTPTGSNLLGIYKHLAIVEAGYLGVTFARPFPEALAGYADDDPVNIDMYATAQESTADIIGLAERVRAHGDATLAALTLDATGTVPWWPQERNTVTVGQILIHLIAEWNRHAGHVDILREQLDGAVGLRDGMSNLPPDDEIDWPAYVAQLQAIADQHR
ncbi:MAG: DinB family protein [Phycicoccus sp.]|nr:DinB family protein [Phycicoccus sp.]